MTNRAGRPVLVALLVIVAMVASLPVVSGSTGYQWVEKTSGTTEQFVSVDFPTPTHGFAATYQGTLLTTTDAGASWSKRYACLTTVCTADTPDRIQFSGVSFPDTTHGFGVRGQQVHATSDGGATWSLQAVLPGANLVAVRFRTASHGHAVGYGDTNVSARIWATTDGGKEWVPQFVCASSAPCTATSIDPVPVALGDVFFVDNANGYAVGTERTILKTTDGGTNWRILSRDSSSSYNDYYVTGVWFTDATTGYVTKGKQILRTINGGVDWNVVHDGTKMLEAIAFADRMRGHAVGGGMLATVDGGSTWHEEGGNGSTYMTAVGHAGAGAAVAVGRDGKLLRYEPAGAKAPDPPLQVRAVARNAAARVSWDAPVTDGGSPITAYTVTADPGGHTASVPGSERSAVVANLTNGTSYRFRVTAANAVGLSLPSNASNQVMPVVPWLATAPLTTPRQDSTATLLWSDECETGSGPDFCGKVLVAGGSVTSAELYHPATSTWSPTGKMNAIRSQHSATALPDGKVIVAGGKGDGGALATAELYDPSTGTWSNVGSLSEPRYGHTATPLPGGGLLVAGGSISLDQSTSSAERYDPASSTWAPAGKMSTPRAGHTATRLQNGQVLVAGGSGGLGAATNLSAELFDPSAGAGTGAWLPTAPMMWPRRSHTATVLEDGRVLVAGGFLNTAEIYDPSKRLWTETAKMTTSSRVSSPSSALLGGSQCRAVPRPQHCGQVIITGGSETTDWPAEAFHPEANGGAGAWVRTGETTRRRYRLSLTSLSDGSVLLTGGCPYDCRLTELYDPSSRADISPPQVLSLDPSSHSPAATTTVTIRGVAFEGVTKVMFGDVQASTASVACGPWPCTDRLTAVAPEQPGEGPVAVTVQSEGGVSLVHPAAMFHYATPRGTWVEKRAPMRARRSHTITELADGKVLVAGGEGTETSEIYDPAGDEPWVDTAGHMQGPRWYHTATLLNNGKLLVVGGRGGRDFSASPLSTAELYDPQTGKWEATGSLGTARWGHTATLLPGGQVLVVGGRGAAPPPGTGEQTLDSVELYDDGTWRPVAPMPRTRSDHSANLLSDGRVLIAGGWDFAGHHGRGAVYDPARDRWDETGSMENPRAGHAAVALPDGRVLLVGGGAAHTAPQLSSAETYDPATNTWSGVAPMFTPRIGPLAEVLHDGRVLVAAGRTIEGELARAEIYDWRSNAWSPAAALHNTGEYRIATMLGDGDVLVVGGNAPAERYHPGSAMPPLPKRIVPPAGPTFGGTVVTITGANLAPKGSNVKPLVRFGALEAEVNSASDTLVVAVAPPQPQGTVPVVVSWADRTSVVAHTMSFTYNSGAWSRTGDMRPSFHSPGVTPIPGATPPPDGRTNRFRHTATVLTDGRVLVAGGAATWAATQLASSQLYDPATATWKETGGLATARSMHTATLMRDGRVLVVGGQGVNTYAVDTPEIYDPVTGKWTRTRHRNLVARLDHSATLLPDGKVLVAGGSPGERERAASTPAAEIYDPISDTWAVASSMTGNRVAHTATALSDGRVLVAGGLTWGYTAGGAKGLSANIRPAVTAELFDPRSGEWTPTGSMAVGRLAHTATLLAEGKVLVAGGDGGGFSGLAASEVYDPVSGTWSGVASMRESRGGHQAVRLESGRVLVAGGGPTWLGQDLPGPSASAELYDPDTESWAPASAMDSRRAGFVLAALLDGRALAVGGYKDRRNHDESAGSDGVEIYTSAPEITRLVPARGPVGGGTEVVIEGSGFRDVGEVSFGGVKVEAMRVESPSRIVAVTPSSDPGPVEVAVTNPGGTSALQRPHPRSMFTFLAMPGTVRDLTAVAASESKITLSFQAPDDGSRTALATSFIVKQSTSPINEENFDAATPLCEGGLCRFPPTKLIQLAVDSLDANTTYHYALRAVGPTATLGEISNSASATTGSVGSSLAGTACPAVAVPTATQLAYPTGYSLVGLPAGTVVGADSPLYSWFDIGAGGAYASAPGTEPAGEGHGYWAWFACPRLIELGAGSVSVSFPLGAYHASMVGNPSGTSPATVSGHDFAARWDAAANEGGGGYILSDYRQPQHMAVGEGAWAFSYSDTTLVINPAT